MFPHGVMNSYGSITLVSFAFVSSGATINQCVGLDYSVIIMEGARSDQVLTIHIILIDYRKTR